MSEFPSSLERTVASALLLLSTEPFFLSPLRSESEEILNLVSERYGQEGLSFSLASRGSRSSGSSLSSDGSSQKINRRELKINPTESPHHLLKLKAVRKLRSKVVWSSNNLKPTELMNSVSDISKDFEGSKEESCLSSGSSEGLSIESRLKITSQRRRNEMSNGEPKKKNSYKSSSIHRRAEDILEFLSASCSSEVKIRQMLGDSPDTSKALRMLLKMEQVKRSGTGGRQDPYIYTVLDHLLHEKLSFAEDG